MNNSTQLSSVLLSKLLTRFTLSIGISTVAIGITSAVLPQPTWAQQAGGVDALGDISPQNEVDSLSGIGGNVNPFDLIHNAQQAGSISPYEYRRGLSDSINNAVDDFRRQQLEQLNNQQTGGNQQPVSSENPSAIAEE
ncbi:MAG: hypothetical protein F6K31_38920 [Symploca sp. SIO2G7]|nr:hypothetical protein [Symploca sp. SIO2G7]